MDCKFRVLLEQELVEGTGRLSSTLSEYMLERLREWWTEEEEDEDEKEADESPSAEVMTRLWRTLRQLGIDGACLPLLRQPVLALLDEHIASQAARNFDTPVLQDLLDWTKEVVLPSLHVLLCSDPQHGTIDRLSDFSPNAPSHSGREFRQLYNIPSLEDTSALLCI